jgi:hypothetical protein
MDEDPLWRVVYTSPFLDGLCSTASLCWCWYWMWLSMSKMPKPIPASAKSRRMAIFTAVKRSFVNVSARAMTGSTLTLEERRRMVAISAVGKVGRHKRGLVVTGGSRITGSGSCWLKLFVRARGTSGAGGPGTEGGTISSGSRKYMHLTGGRVSWYVAKCGNKKTHK